MTRRLTVLGALLVSLSLLAAALLVEVIATVFFAITVAYLLLPFRRRLTDRGLSPWWASAAATVGAFLGALVLLIPLVAVLWLRADDLVAILRTVPDRVTIEFLGYAYVLTLQEVLAAGISFARGLARSIPSVVPVLLIKLSLFALLVFSLLFDEFSIRRGMLAIAPSAYEDVVAALERRARETLFAIYVLQAATALATFLAALPLFFLLGYRYFVALATVAAVLQFIPVVGPSVLVTGVALYQVATGHPVAGAVLFVVGNVLVSWLPDVLVRPRLARETANLPGSLYFVGFVGGLLTLGPVGVIAGPLVVALVVEAADLLSVELNDVDADGLHGAADVLDPADVEDDSSEDVDPSTVDDSSAAENFAEIEDVAPADDSPSAGTRSSVGDGSPSPGSASKEP